MSNAWDRFREALVDLDIDHHNLIGDAALLQTQRDDARSDLARVTAERDAAVARNIILFQQKTAEAEAARIDRIPVADFYHRVREVLEAAGVGEEVLDKVRDIPGWDGTEGGYKPGLQTTTFVYREDLVKAESERDAALALLERAVKYAREDRMVTPGYCDLMCGHTTSLPPSPAGASGQPSGSTEWYWRPPGAEHAEGPHPTREAAIADAQADGYWKFHVGRCRHLHVGIGLDVDDVMERIENVAHEEVGYDDDIFGFVIDRQHAQEALQKWATEHIKVEMGWYWSEAGEETIVLDNPEQEGGAA